MVPLWDVLNHVTGAANVRLNHDADSSALQMIATSEITPGSELINDYGPCSSGELLFRCVGRERRAHTAAPVIQA